MDIKLLDLPTKEIYTDLFKPGMQKVGKALSTVLDAGNLILLPLKLLNEKSKIYFRDNIKKYSDNLDAKNLTPTQVPPYVGLPILDKLTYLERGELADSFINLLTKASFEETQGLTHPVFISILNNLSTDEARILFHSKSKNTIPLINIYIHRYPKDISADNSKTDREVRSRAELKKMITYAFQDRGSDALRYAWNLTNLPKEVTLIFPENVDIYIENLIHNGLIYIEENAHYHSDITDYERLEKHTYKNVYEQLDSIIKEMTVESEDTCDVETRRGCIKFTEIGKKFIEACINI